MCVFRRVNRYERFLFALEDSLHSSSLFLSRAISVILIIVRDFSYEDPICDGITLANYIYIYIFIYISVARLSFLVNLLCLHQNGEGYEEESDSEPFLEKGLEDDDAEKFFAADVRIIMLVLNISSARFPCFSKCLIRGPPPKAVVPCTVQIPRLLKAPNRVPMI